MSARGPDMPASQTTTVAFGPYSVRIFTSMLAKPKIAFVGSPREVAIDPAARRTPGRRGCCRRSGTARGRAHRSDLWSAAAPLSRARTSAPSRRNCGSMIASSRPNRPARDRKQGNDHHSECILQPHAARAARQRAGRARRGHDGDRRRGRLDRRDRHRRAPAATSSCATSPSTRAASEHGDEIIDADQGASRASSCWTPPTARSACTRAARSPRSTSSR